jgi:head-tail adaptor
MSRPHNRSGRQRWLISFQAPVQTETAVDDTTLPLTTWPAFGLQCEAEIEEISGGKRSVSGQPQAEQRYRLTCRWQPGIRSYMRIVWPIPDQPKRILNIESVVDVKGLHQELSIVAAEMTPEE